MSGQGYPTSPTPIHLDGTTLEGGGQLLRLALSLSSLTQIPIYVTDIRGKRPGKVSGLKASHLAGVKWLSNATAATTEGMEVKNPLAAEQRLQSTRVKNEHVSRTEGEKEGVWEDIFDNGQLVRRQSHIPMSSPGSILLVLQAILPYLLMSNCNNVEGQKTVVPLRVTIEGGTNVSSSPSIEYFSQVLLPMLSQKLSIPPITTSLHKRGWSTGRSEIGSVTFDIEPLPQAFVLPTFSFQDRGELAKVHVSVLAPEATARNRIRDKVTAQLLAYSPEIEILFPVDENSGSEKRLYLLLVAETSNGYRLGRDWLFDEKARGLSMEQLCERLVSKVVKDLKKELKHGGCVDEYMQDQTVVFQALAAGKAEVDCGIEREATLHTKTARWVTEQMIGAGFDELGRCQGLGYAVGEDFQKRSGMPLQA
ncbi:hypothetical protein HO173_002148 [Letharia columbiana]|uniref:RNA 3'-terminal phosphate cyclase domain-containing protein n=1 Tax=Letharia columbiana TaxID=112416 RepID=A0A8H6L8H7_9LECA|nr:uncharacterized protein HO173_002148 [Letharia columbiana]KAF6239603.1 hypothetical protein HO173_002148 [Letharia columbiana]